ncbi:MAG: universal stress protein [Actinocrinis sp.]
MFAASAPVVVGIDGTEASLAALRWAAGEAAAHGAALIAVYVLDSRRRPRAPYAPIDSQDTVELDPAAMVEREIERAAVANVTRVVEVGVPSVQLMCRAIGARMLVLGHGDHQRHRDGAGPDHGPALGPVARACVARATCPVVVVPIPARNPARETAAPTSQLAKHAPLIGSRALYARGQRRPVGHR